MTKLTDLYGLPSDSEIESLTHSETDDLQSNDRVARHLKMMRDNRCIPLLRKAHETIEELENRISSLIKELDK